MRVFSNTAMSLDGRIGVLHDQHLALGTELDRARMSRLRARADAVLVGGQTFRNWPLPCVERPADRRDRARPIINAVLTRRGILDAPTRRWEGAPVQLLVLGDETLDAQAHRQRWGCEVHVHARPTVSWAIEVLARRGCKQILVEGGGSLIGQLADAGLLDEMFVTICPRLIGVKDAPSLADGMRAPGGGQPRLRVLDLERAGDEIFVHYAVSGSC